MELSVDPSSTIGHLKDRICRELHISLQQLIGVVQDSELISDMFRNGQELVLGDMVITTSDGERSDTVYNGNISHHQSTQINGPVNDGDASPISMSRGRITYIANVSRGKSLQVNGPVSGVGIFGRGRGRTDG